MKAIFIGIAALSTLAAATVVAGSSLGSGARGGTDDGSAPDTPQFGVTVSGYPVFFPPEEATRKSDLVVVGTVGKLSDARWSTPDGKAPPDAGRGHPEFFIYRTAAVDVETVLAGNASVRSVPVTVFGGQADGIVMEASDIGPDLKKGDRVILFLNRPGHPGLPMAPAANWSALMTYHIEGTEARNEFIGRIGVEDLKTRVSRSAAASGQSPSQ